MTATAARLSRSLLLRVIDPLCAAGQITCSTLPENQDTTTVPLTCAWGINVADSAGVDNVVQRGIHGTAFAVLALAATKDVFPAKSRYDKFLLGGRRWLEATIRTPRRPYELRKTHKVAEALAALSVTHSDMAVDCVQLLVAGAGPTGAWDWYLDSQPEALTSATIMPTVYAFSGLAYRSDATLDELLSRTAAGCVAYFLGVPRLDVHAAAALYWFTYVLVTHRVRLDRLSVSVWLEELRPLLAAVPTFAPSVDTAAPFEFRQRGDDGTSAANPYVLVPVGAIELALRSVLSYAPGGQADARGIEIAHSLAERLELPDEYPKEIRVISYVARFLAYLSATPEAFERQWLPNSRRVSRPPEPVAAADTSDDRLRRRQVLDEIRSVFDEVAGHLEPDDVSEVLRGRLQNAFVSTIAALRISDDTESREFAIDVHEKRVAFGRSLLHALTALPGHDAGRIGALIIVHEVYHSLQRLTTTNYHNVGRAAVALEEVDFWADVVAVLVLTKFQARNEGPKATRSVGAILHNYVRLVLVGMRTFDVAEQGEVLHRLPERRLRRYLTWALQLSRARTVQSLQHTSEMLRSRLLCELAPLSGYLESDTDKIVTRPSADCQLFVVCNAELRRLPAAPPSFDPASLVEAVRCYDDEALMRAMQYVRDSAPELLIPWADMNHGS